MTSTEVVSMTFCSDDLRNFYQTRSIHLDPKLFLLQGLLDDVALEVLCDEEFARLDLSFSHVSSEGICSALPKLSRLKYISMLG